MKDIAQQLLVGSRRIDQMKSEINQVVGMVIGLLKTVYPQTDKCREFCFGSDLCRWRGRVSIGRHMGNLQVDLECHALFEYLAYCYRSEFSKAGTFSDAQHTASTIHQDLHTFVEGMVKEFPALKEALKPFIDASEHSVDG